MPKTVWIAGWLLALLATTSPALAQERSPAARQTLVELSRVLGESHAIRQACEGSADQQWRERMAQMLEREDADQALKARLSIAFNDGYHSGMALYPKCSPAARAEGRRIAASGQALSGKLGSP